MFCTYPSTSPLMFHFSALPCHSVCSTCVCTLHIIPFNISPSLLGLLPMSARHPPFLHYVPMRILRNPGLALYSVKSPESDRHPYHDISTSAHLVHPRG